MKDELNYSIDEQGLIRIYGNINLKNVKSKKDLLKLINNFDKKANKLREEIKKHGNL